VIAALIFSYERFPTASSSRHHAFATADNAVIVSVRLPFSIQSSLTPLNTTAMFSTLFF